MSPEPFEARCSFCAKLHTAVAKLIAGPGLYICDGCVGLCVDILAEESPAAPPSLPEWASLSNDELLKRIRSPHLRRPRSNQGCAIACTNCESEATPGPASARRWA
jgi:hypothetical protein